MRYLLFIISFFITCHLHAQMPIDWTLLDSPKEKSVMLHLSIPKGYYLYADQLVIHATSDSQIIEPIKSPNAIIKWDTFQEANLAIYQGENSWVYDDSLPRNTQFKIQFQGCQLPQDGDDLGRCFFPEERIISFGKSDSNIQIGSESDYLKRIISDFNVKKLVNYGLNEEGFLQFLSQDTIQSDAVDLNQLNIGLALLLIIIGGVALNLTPCVLPMIPINLAIIGAGMNAKNRYSGFIRGLIYGAGIAIAYGILGLLAIFFGESLGILNSSWQFNAGVAIVMILFALATFEVFRIDFTRFQRWSPSIQGKTHVWAQFVGIFLIGALSAILSGACVAPILSSTLLYTIAEWNQGNLFAIFIPFALGVGMAIPWPFAGAGFALLPKPGAWMMMVKKIMGTVIVLIAIYFAYLAFDMYQAHGEKIDNESVLNQAMVESLQTRKPIVIDFYATWCTACRDMDKNVLPLPSVQKALESYIFIKLSAENPKAADIAPLLRHFNLVGLPGLVILTPK